MAEETGPATPANGETVASELQGEPMVGRFDVPSAGIDPARDALLYFGDNNQLFLFQGERAVSLDFKLIDEIGYLLEEDVWIIDAPLEAFEPLAPEVVESLAERTEEILEVLQPDAREVVEPEVGTEVEVEEMELGL